MPRRSNLSCTRVTSLGTSLAAGQGNESASRRFCQRQKPVASQYRILTTRRVFPQNTKYAPESGPSGSDDWAISESPLICFRISVSPVLRNIRLSFDNTMASLLAVKDHLEIWFCEDGVKLALTAKCGKLKSALTLPSEFLRNGEHSTVGWSLYRDTTGPIMLTLNHSKWSRYHDPARLKWGNIVTLVPKDCSRKAG